MRVEFEVVEVFPLELLLPFSCSDGFNDQVQAFLFKRFECEFHGLDFDKTVGLRDFLELEGGFDEGKILN